MEVSGRRFEGEFTEDMTQELFAAIRDNPIVKVPSDFVLVGRAFGLLALRRCSRRRPILASVLRTGV